MIHFDNFIKTELKLPLGTTLTMQPVFDDVDVTAGYLASITIKLPYQNCYSTLPIK